LESRALYVVQATFRLPKLLQMIDLVLTFLNTNLDTYLRLKLDPANTNPFVQLSNIAFNDSDTSNAGNGANVPSNAFITLVNIEEDRISKSPENYVRQDNTTIYKNPKVYLNLYILFAVNLPVYSESLKRLSFIIQFFQYQSVFTPLTSPGLPTGVEKLILDLNTLSFQDLNNLWGILGSKYLPSVMYKLRLISISEEFVQGDGPMIQHIGIDDKTLMTQ
jgi:Pvc16 N-terminal domain